MKVEVKLDPACAEPKVVILTAQMTQEISALLQQLSGASAQVIAGFREGQISLLEQENIIRVYAADGKVFAVTEDGQEYRLRLRLYELEDRLDRRQFVRISNSEIINLKKVKSFDLSLSGTICVSLTNGGTAYVSRRYIARIKQILGI